MVVLSSLCWLAALATIVNALWASDIESCPALAPRAHRATSADDVRPDDIKVIAGIGDSFITASRVYKSNTRQPPPSIMQYEGLGYSMGGDKGAKTLPNFFKNYSPGIKGASVGQRVGSRCNESGCMRKYDLGDYPYVPSLDNLNAGLPGAMSVDLDLELDYITQRMKEIPGINFKQDWKLITINLGANDQCALCGGDRGDRVSPVQYRDYFEAAIDRIQQTIPRVIVNLMGPHRTSHIMDLTKDKPYCKEAAENLARLFSFATCSCYDGNATHRQIMDDAVNLYNGVLREIYERHKANPDPNFGVVYTPANLDILHFPLEVVLSDVDCIHPTLVGQQWLAKSLWNDMFAPQSSKLQLWTFDADKLIYCPGEDDRIRLD